MRIAACWCGSGSGCVVIVFLDSVVVGNGTLLWNGKPSPSGMVLEFTFYSMSHLFTHASLIHFVFLNYYY